MTSDLCMHSTRSTCISTRINYPMHLQLKNPIRKISNIAQYIAQQIAQRCQCQYSGSFIVDSELSCTTENDVIYQARLLSTDGRTALEIRNVTQQWVLSRPAIIIDSLSYQVDSDCLTVIKELGITSCDAVSESKAQDQRPIISASVAAVVVIMLACVGAILIIAFFLKRKLKNHNER